MNVDTRHWLSRDRLNWSGTRAGLVVDASGALTLASLPGTTDHQAVALATALPTARDASGLAVGPNGALMIADTAHGRLLYRDAACASESWLPPFGAAGGAPGQFDLPRGLAFSQRALLVADSGNGRIQHLALPELEPNLAWYRWATPIGVAVDSQDRVAVIDGATKRLERVDAFGDPDSSFDAAVQSTGVLVDPRWVAIGADDALFVSDTGANRVFIFDAEGALHGELAGPAGWQPGALATSGTQLFVADASTAQIHAFDPQGAWQCALPQWSGPVTALALDADGNLIVKPALDATVVSLSVGLAFGAFGTLSAGPLDAGQDCDWERVWFEFDAAADATCTLSFAAQAAAIPPPPAAAWTTLASSDALLSVVTPAGAPGSKRYLWLRAQLLTSTGLQTPRLLQLRAATTAEDYLAYLPQTYRRHDLTGDGSEGFLARLMKLMRGEFGAIEELLDDMPRLARPEFTAAPDLTWLAGWLALELPQIRGDDERRALIARAVQLFDRRGTPASIEEFVELHTGIRPTIVEAFEGRQLWILGESSRLGFDTALFPFEPNGWVVPDTAIEEACCEAGAVDTAVPCGCPSAEVASTPTALGPVTIGRMVVGEGGPLAQSQIGLPLFSDDAFKFCVFVDAYRLCSPGALDEIYRIVDREKPAHTDYRLELVAPDLRVGFQSRIGIDAIVGGDAPGWPGRKELGALGFDTRLATRDGATRLDDIVLGNGLTLS